MEKPFIYIIFGMVLFGGLLTTVGIPGYFTLFIEVSIIILFTFSILSKRGHHTLVAHNWQFLVAMLFVTVISMGFNETTGIDALMSIRLLWRFYFFYLALITLEIDDNLIKKVNSLLGLFLWLQLPVVAYKFTLYGVSEKTMGAYAVVGGSLTTIIPVSVLFFVAGYYFIYSPKKSYLLLGIGYIIFSIVGAKRAVFFIYPVQFLVIYYYIYMRNKIGNITISAFKLVTTFIIIIVVSSSFLYFNKSLNPEKRIGGSIDLKYALDFALFYETREDWYGYTTGRASTTMRIFETLWKMGTEKLAFGVGPGKFTEFPIAGKKKMKLEKVKEEFRFSYGTTSMTRMAIEYGVLGVIVYSLMILSFAKMCWKYYKIETDDYWKAFAAGSVGFAYAMLFFFFVYGDVAFWSDLMPALFFYSMAVVYLRLQRIRDVENVDENLQKERLGYI